MLGTGNKSSSYVLNKPRRSEAMKTVVVLGVERGGTSMVAGIIRALGIDMGKKVGLNHEDPQFLAEDTKVLANRIRARNRESSVWGFKVPKSANFLAFYEEHLRKPYYVVVHRNALAIADSWVQRGAGNPLDVIEHTIRYHTQILDHCRQTKRPVLMLNYERCVASDEGKLEAVQTIANFLDVELTEDLKERAEAMITGDGKGYVNLPEHFFLVTPAAARPERKTIEIVNLTPDLSDAAGWIDYDSLKKKQIHRLASGENLPRRFWMELDVDGSANFDFAAEPLRIYFDFTGQLFPAHCARPKVKPGKNIFLVETSGNASAFAFGPLEPGVKIRTSVKIYTADNTDSGDAPVVADRPHRGKSAAKRWFRLPKLFKR